MYYLTVTARGRNHEVRTNFHLMEETLFVYIDWFSVVDEVSRVFFRTKTSQKHKNVPKIINRNKNKKKKIVSDKNKRKVIVTPGWIDVSGPGPANF